MKKMRFAPLLIFCCLLLTACSLNRPHTRETFAMDTVMRLTAYGPKGEQALADGVAILNEVEKRLSATDENSEIHLLNASGEGSVSPETTELLVRTLELSERTGGSFRPDLYSVTSLWGFTTERYCVPSAEEREQVLRELENASVSVEGNYVTLSGSLLDMGASAKGYAAQKIVDSWRELGVRSGILSLGGNVQTLGKKPDGSLWRVGITDPVNVGETLCVLSVGETAMVTSGGYQRYFEEDGVRYCHIMDPATAGPVESDLLSVTVLADDGLLADCLSTALYVMGFDGAVDYWRSEGGFEMVLVDAEARVFATKGLENVFSGCPFEVIGS